MNLVFVYFIVLGIWVYADSKKRPYLYEVPQEIDDGSPYQLQEVVNVDEVLAENKQMKGVYSHWIGLFKTYIYPMIVVIFLLYVARLVLDNLEFLQKVSEEGDAEPEQ